MGCEGARIRVYVRPGMRMSICVSVRQLEGAGVIEDVYTCVTAVYRPGVKIARASPLTHMARVMCAHRRCLLPFQARLPTPNPLPFLV